MIAKLIWMPIFVTLTIIRVVLGIVIRLSDWLFYTIGFLLLLVTILSYYFELETGASIRQMIIGSGVFFLIPQTASLLEGLLEVCTLNIADRIGGK